MTREGVCIHGGLRRQCETCDLADQLEKMTIRLAALESKLRIAQVALAALNPPRDSHAN